MKTIINVLILFSFYKFSYFKDETVFVLKSHDNVMLNVTFSIENYQCLSPSGDSIIYKYIDFMSYTISKNKTGLCTDGNNRVIFVFNDGKESYRYNVEKFNCKGYGYIDLDSDTSNSNCYACKAAYEITHKKVSKIIVETQSGVYTFRLTGEQTALLTKQFGVLQKKSNTK